MLIQTLLAFFVQSLKERIKSLIFRELLSDHCCVDLLFKKTFLDKFIIISLLNINKFRFIVSEWRGKQLISCSASGSLFVKMREVKVALLPLICVQFEIIENLTGCGLHWQFELW